jgi:hypothetical protein
MPQLIDEGGRLPCSGSVPLPEKLITVEPATYVVPATGVRISATGKRLLITVRVAALLVAVLPVLFATITLKFPLSVRAV